MNYKELVSTYENTDSLRKEEITLYKKELSNAEEHIKKLKSSRRKIIASSTVGGIVLLLIGLLL